ncbi:putative phage abortive infection protein [Lactococcus garvieae]|uniref:putative phage abortive infection protein n=1 Tax=Lactococcus garvieae TaxID=1363 RepID=UPI00254D30DF|nr:putative phage abortive infection protein [Lactococcus garvieae]
MNSNFTSADWLNFWGNIIGSVVGVVGAFCVMLSQLKREREKTRKEKIDNTFFNLLTLFQNVKGELDTDKFKIFLEQGIQSQISWEREKKFDEEFAKEKLNFIDNVKTFNELTKKKYNRKCDVVIRELENGKNGRYFFEVGHLSNMVMDEDKEIFENQFKNINKFRDRDIDLDSVSRNELINEEHIIEIVKNTFIKLQGDSGNYLRTLYRCLKYIMDTELTMDEKKFYSGVLRGILSTDEMLVVFYNCIYYEKGKKFKNLLEMTEKGKRLDFFGDKKDLEDGNGSLFFGEGNFFFPEYDMRHLEELINGTPTKAN